MSTKKKLEALDVETGYAFINVKKDIIFLFNLIEEEKRTQKAKFAGLERTIKQVLRELTKNHRKGNLSGNTYPTLAGKVKAIAEQLGIEFAVEQRKVTPTKVVAQKKATVKKGK